MSRLRVDRTCRRWVRVVDQAGRVVVERCWVADSFGARLVGLLGTAQLDADEGLWLTPCSAIHMFGMRFPIAVAFLDEGGGVMRLLDPVLPGTRLRQPGSRSVIEAPLGAFSACRVGDILRVVRPD